ncbi:MAG: hypothetical protein QM621_14855 [Aeromicrobium sp.]|uniref:hypothetical protein n=1 Tax=Aeromicrobium sp. TaxID=1871063 RepID=UPI0039E63574
MAGPIVISIVTNARKAVADLNETATTAQKVGGAFQQASLPAAAALGAVAAYGKGALDAASDAQQSIGATKQVFGEYAGDVVKKSRQAAQAIGLSANEYRELANVSGAMLKGAGLPLEQVAGLTDQLNTRAADLAATFGGSTKEAVEAVGSLLRGEADPMERYGVSIKQADVNARLAAQGLAGLEGEALKQAEMQARLDLLFEKTAESEGQFASEADTAAGAAQRNTAALADQRAEIGERLLPAYARIQQIIASVVGFLADHEKATFAAGVAVAGLAATVLTVNVAMKAYAAIQVIVTAATKLGTVAQYAYGTAWLVWRLAVVAGTAAMGAARTAMLALNAAVVANPIGLLVVAVLAVIAALVWFFTQTELGKKIVTAAWDAMKAAGAACWEAIKAVGAGIGTVVGWLAAGVKLYLTAVVAYWRMVINVVVTVVTAVASGIGRMVGFVAGIPGKVKDALSGAGEWLKSAGKKIIDGLIDGIASKFGAVKNKLGELTGKLTSWKGPPKRDKRLLTPAGTLIIDGLIYGIAQREAALRRKLQGVTDDIGGMRPELDLADADADRDLAVRTAHDGGTLTVNRTYQITVNVPPGTDRAAVGREVQECLDEWERIGGRPR